MNKTEQHETIEKICKNYKGILASDESTGTIGKRLNSINVENTLNNRIKYRNLLFTTPNLNKYISGVITFEETLLQIKDNGKKLIQTLIDNDIVIGIKVDKSVKPLYGTDGETVTQGIDDLDIRCRKYYEAGARFAKWRAVLKMCGDSPSDLSIKENSLTLARYASICQNNGLVPIVEPEILMDGNHTIIDSYNATVKVLKSVYKELVNHKVDLSCTLLKPNIIRQGIENTSKINYEQVGKLTTKAINEAVPKNVPGIVFLSGGMSSIESTIVLNEINKHKGDIPSRLTFSYGRALQQTVLLSWEGKDENKKNAQQELNKRAKANGLASMGEYINDEKIDETLHEKNYSY
uniref:fructose-bisphosphate aldolase n=1 Tax=viral metagenome TaxID=1070528 RepID=A0A6C0LZN6_9ZZZZ